MTSHTYNIHNVENTLTEDELEAAWKRVSREDFGKILSKQRRLERLARAQSDLLREWAEGLPCESPDEFQADCGRCRRCRSIYQDGALNAPLEVGSKMKSKGTYTLHSVAFPSLSLYDRVVDDLNVSFNREGEFKFEWVGLGDDKRWPHGALRVCAFSDSFSALRDEGICSVLDRIRRRPEKSRDIAPEKLIEMLEEVGFSPSRYHAQGLMERGHLTLEEKGELNALIAAQLKAGN